MDEPTRNMLEEMDRFNRSIILKDGRVVGPAMHAAEVAIENGLNIPWHEITILVEGYPLGIFVPGPSLKMNVQLGFIPSRSELDRLETAAHETANNVFHVRPFRGNAQVTKNFDPYGWGQRVD